MRSGFPSETRRHCKFSMNALLLQAALDSIALMHSMARRQLVTLANDRLTIGLAVARDPGSCGLTFKSSMGVHARRRPGQQLRAPRSSMIAGSFSTCRGWTLWPSPYRIARKPPLRSRAERRQGREAADAHRRRRAAHRSGRARSGAGQIPETRQAGKITRSSPLVTAPRRPRIRAIFRYSKGRRIHFDYDRDVVLPLRRRSR